MKKIVLAGTGIRCYSMFAKPIFDELKKQVRICGLYDKNPKRAKAVSAECGNAPVYDSFDKMMEEVKPDYVLVATVDSVHHEYIVKALDRGCNVITEKPMTIDAEKCKLIFEAEKRNGKSVTVTFNCRFMPFYSEIKKLLKENRIGEVLNIDFQYLLDTRHGADYFRRWHRRMENSGGLLLHKSTHHFDVINWFLEDTPEEVAAFGTNRFYGPTRKRRGERCLTCSYQDSCEFYFDITASELDKRLYLDTEDSDGYIRDACVFSDEINIYDTMAVTVKYEKGTTLLYSLVTYSPYEGWSLSVTGTKGRLEAQEFYSGGRADEPFNVIQVYDMEGNVTAYHMKKLSGAHGGGDSRLRQMLFDEGIKDELGRMANSYDGAKSLLIGACANQSIKQNSVVSIKKVLEDMECAL